MSPRERIGNRSDAAHSRAAELVERQARLNHQLDAYFREIAEVKDAMRDVGSLWNGPVMDPPLEAAYQIWSSRGPKETRIELERLGEVPLMSLEP